MLHLAVEASDDMATMYLSGELVAGDAFLINRACAELPARVRTLRLDLHGIAHVDDEAMDAVRGVLRFWREARRGSFRLLLSSEHIIATYAEGEWASPPISMRSAPPHIVDDAASRTAMYL